MSRELDDQVARLMGWEFIVPEMIGRRRGDFGESLTVPSYSTDPATDAEKVEWLRAKMGDGFGFVEITVWSPANTGDGKPVEARFDGWLGDFKVDGATMTEALANLCIAVAEAEAKK